MSLKTDNFNFHEFDVIYKIVEKEALKVLFLWDDFVQDKSSFVKPGLKVIIKYHLFYNLYIEVFSSLYLSNKHTFYNIEYY